MNDISARDRVLKALAEVERLELERKWAILEAIYGPVELNKYERCRKSRKTLYCSASRRPASEYPV